MDFLLLIFLVFYSIILHEISHGYVAYKLGDPTAKYEGRLSLNPLVHLDPFGTLLLPLFTAFFFNGLIFGYAKPVPYNPLYFKDKNRDPILVALAGPLVNLGLALFFLFLHKQNFLPQFSSVFFSVFRINLILALFNLLPLPPLDGSKLYLLFIPFEEYAFLEAYGFVFVILFLLLFNDPLFFLFNKIIDFVYNLF